MTRSWILIGLAAASLAGCGFNVAFDGTSVSERNGRMFVDEVPVDFHREVALQGELADLSTLTLGTASGLIDVVGVPGNTFELVVDVYSELEGDGEVEVSGGRLSVESNDGGKVLINGIRGRIPETAGLVVYSGTGEVVLTGFVGESDIEIDGGTGSIRIVSCGVESIEVDTGTGNLHLEDTTAALLKLRSGTGELAAQGCEFRSAWGDSGTGDFEFRDCRIDAAEFSSGTGDVKLLGSVVTDLTTMLGTGDVVRQ